MLFAAVAALLCSLFISGAVEICGPKLNWSTSKGSVLLNGQPFVLKGISYYGFELNTFCPSGLWGYPLNQILNFVKENNFNAIRIPFSMELVKNNPNKTAVDCNSNPTLCHMSALNLMDAFIEKCAEKGILVVLDAQFLSIAGQISELWHDNGEYTEAEVIRLWDQLLIRFGSRWNLLALDIKNEPHGIATWDGNVPTAWNLYVQRFIEHVGQRHPNYKGLFFVEGIDNRVCNPNPNSGGHFWGENLEGVHCYPIRVPDQELSHRIVYTPHVYGPEQFPMDYFNAGDFPRNMPGVWNTHFGFVQALTEYPVVIGEWGWDKAGKGETWGNAFADYMHSNCMSNNIWWCLNPGVYGIMNNDYKTGDAHKLAFLHSVQPDPTMFVERKPNICITHGSFTNKECGKR